MRLLTIAAVIFLGLSAFLVAGNWLGIAEARRTKVGFSCVPILGGLFGGVGFLLLPRLRLLALLPPVVDIGCVPMLVALLVHIVRSKAVD